MTNPTMRDTESPPAEDKTTPLNEGEGERLRRGLWLRVGVAGVLIAALLGGLSVLDEMSAPEKPSLAVATAPLPAAAPALTAPAAPVQVPAFLTDAVAGIPDTPSTPDHEAEQGAAQEGSAEPTLNAPLQADAPALRPLTPPASARAQAMLRPSAATSAARQPAPSPAAELARPPVVAHAPASRPLSQAVARAAASGGMLLQLGVFNSTAHAEELRAKLELNGIPAQIESRVQVGQLAHREEAEQMREKLKKLGLDGGVLVATKK